MKYIITEQQYQKLNRSSEIFSKAIVKLMNQYVSNGERKILNKQRNYGNFREDWCIEGKERISAFYYFEDGRYNTGSMLVSNEIVETISKSLSLRKSYVLYVILEWYDEIMVPKFEQIVGESGLFIEDIDTSNKDYECIPEPSKPEGITDEEMITYIINHTLYSREKIMKKIESGEEELEELYLHIVDIQNRKKITGL